DPDRREVTYRATADGTHPACGLRLKARGRGVFDFAIDCKAADGTTIPFAPALCTQSAPTTQLTTTFSINAASPVELTIVQTWGCTMHDGLVSELRFPAEASSGGSGSSGSGTNRAPRADFRADPLAGRAPLTVRFTNRSSDPDGDAITSTWDFGDGTQSTESDPTHTYDSAGKFIVRLLVTDAQGLSSGPKATTISVTAGTGGGPTPGNHAPLADFDADPTSGAAPLTVSFVSRSTDSAGDAIAAHWDFGDGSASGDLNPTHVYTSGGEFVVTLVVTDAHGLPSSPKSESISVTGGGSGGGTGEGGLPGGPNRAPRADFRADPTTGDAPLVVSFSNRSTDPDGDLLTAHWDFGDGFRSSEASPRHTYTSAGEYTVTLTVTDARGLSSEPKREDVTVRAGRTSGVPAARRVSGGTNRAPRADFRADPPSGAAPLIVTFSNRSTDADGDTLAAHWDFGDGSESSEMSPAHTY